MTYTLKSDLTVADPNGRFDFLTPLGVAPQPLKLFMDDMTAAGYVLEQAEFTALRTFIRNLTAAGLWDKVREVYPLMGNSADTAAIKLKEFAGSGRAMAKLYNFNDTRLEIVGGKVLGKASKTFSSSQTPCLDTGVTVSDLNDSFSISALLGTVSPVSGGQYIFGASQIENATVTTEASFSGDGSTSESRIRNQSTAASFNAPNLSPAIWQFDATSSIGRVFRGGALIGSEALTGRNTGIGQTQKISLFARTGMGSNVDLNGGIATQVRFVVLAQGGMTEAQIATLHDEVETVSAALGKSFP